MTSVAGVGHPCALSWRPTMGWEAAEADLARSLRGGRCPSPLVLGFRPRVLQHRSRNLERDSQQTRQPSNGHSHGDLRARLLLRMSSAPRIGPRVVRVHLRHVAPALFVHINKTGGTSVERALNLPSQHLTALQLREVVGRATVASNSNVLDRTQSLGQGRVALQLPSRNQPDRPRRSAPVALRLGNKELRPTRPSLL